MDLCVYLSHTQGSRDPIMVCLSYPQSALVSHPFDFAIYALSHRCNSTLCSRYADVVQKSISIFPTSVIYSMLMRRLSGAGALGTTTERIPFFSEALTASWFTR